MLHAREDQHLVPVVVLDEVDQQVLLHLAADRVHLLRDQLGGLVAARDLDQHRRVQQAIGEGLDLVAEGGREQQALLLLRQHREHLLDVVDEAHVEHAVGFVEHEDLDVREVERALAVVVEQAARRGDEDVDAAAQLVDLRLHADAAEHHHAGELGVLAVGAHAFLDLRRELAGRREDEGADRQLGRAASRTARLGHQALQHRQHEAGGLAGAGLRAAHDVAAGEHGGDGLRLDRGGRGVARFVHGTQQRLGKAEGVEGHGVLPNSSACCSRSERQSKADGGGESEATASTLTGRRWRREARHCTRLRIARSPLSRHDCHARPPGRRASSAIRAARRQ